MYSTTKQARREPQQFVAVLLALSLAILLASGLRSSTTSYLLAAAAFIIAYSREVRRLWSGRHESSMGVLADAFGAALLVAIAGLHLDWWRFP